MKNRLKKIYEESKLEMTNDSLTKRVEIIIMKYQEKTAMI